MSDNEVVFLGDVLDFKNGKNHPGLVEGARFQVFGANGPIGLTTDFNSESLTIVIGRVGSYCGSLHLAEGKTWVTDNAIAAMAKVPEETKFWFYALRHLNLHRWRAGSGQPLLTQGTLKGLRAPAISSEDRLRIAGVLGALDDLIDTNENLISDLDELSMSLFLDAWDGTSWCEIQDLGKLTMGQSPPGTTLSDEQDGLPFFQGVRDFGSRFPTQRIFTKDSKRQVREGAILIAVRAPVGEANVALTEVSIGRGLAGLEATDPAIAFQALRATSETWDAHQGTGTVFSSINGNELKKARVPLVRDDSLSQVLAVLDMQFKELFLENQQLRRTRDELLPLLMSGKIRVREAEELVKERVG